jgi:hypothetical protein
MKKNFFAWILFFFAIQLVNAQIAFEKGYFINNQGTKTSCWIKNLDWNDNPTRIQYKLSENASVQTIDIENMQEFSIENISKYVRFTVDMDRSSNRLTELSSKRSPEFQKETLFLRVLVGGSATLYGYSENSLLRFFLSKNDQEPVQLVFKKFSISDSNLLRENNQFRNQLWDALKCKSLSKSTFEQLEYKLSEISQVVEEYNSCGNKTSKNYTKKSNQGKFHMSLRAGIGLSSFKVQNSLFTTRNIDFSGTSYRVGVEFEYVFPFAKNKWAIILEPTYRAFSSSTELTGFTPEINYRSVEMQSGIRHYLFLPDGSKLFINAIFAFDFASESSEIRYRDFESYELNGEYNLALGVGYKFKDKFSAELRHQFNRNLIWSSKYISTSVVLGYTLF